MILQKTYSKLVLKLFLWKLVILASEPCFAQFRNVRKPRLAINENHKKGVLLDMSAFYYSETVKGVPAASSDSKSQNSMADIKLGYIASDGFYFGGQYSIKESQINGIKQKGKGSAAGVGYYALNGLEFRAYYRFHESLASYSKGAGYQVQLGYSSKFLKHFLIGILADYRHIKYEANSLNINTISHTVQTIQPALTLGLLID